MSLASLLEPVQSGLERVEKRLHESAASDYPLLSAVLQDLLAAGGKRLRPAIVLLASSFHPVDVEGVTNLASAVEMLHTATLVHDDMIDGSLVRRGHPTVNSRWSSEATVLTGDFLFARSAALAAATGSVDVVRLFAATLGTICDGELRQLLGTMLWSPSREDYDRRIYSKTASLFAAAAETGGVLSGAPEAEVRTLREYGLNLGMAFQVVDDVLDYAGDPEKMGKPTGSDLRQGIITLPAILYLERNGGRASLAALRQSVEEGKSDEAVKAVLAAGCDREAMLTADAYAARARAALAGLLATPIRDTMSSLADFVVQRNW